MGAVSVIVTTRNEATNIVALLESLRGQDALEEVVVVDAMSDDGTLDVARSVDGVPLQLVQEPCSRGGGRNLGASIARGDVLAFIDGDCTAAPGWVEAMAGTSDRTLVAGNTQHTGPYPAKRAPILVDGQDISWPSCNLAITKDFFHELGGFDAGFVTAEDMDLNLRAVQAGGVIRHAPDAVVHARTRDTWKAHLQQAYDYGVGRAQLEAKHGAIAATSKWKALSTHRTPRALARLWAGYRGYRAGRNES